MTAAAADNWPKLEIPGNRGGGEAEGTHPNTGKRTCARLAEGP